jgi:hypothetical protein
MSIIHKGADTAKYSVALPIRLSDSLEADAVKTVAARGVVMNLPFEVDCACWPCLTLISSHSILFGLLWREIHPGGGNLREGFSYFLTPEN